MITLWIVSVALIFYGLLKLIGSLCDYVHTSKCLSTIPGPSVGGLLGDLGLMNDHSSDDFYARLQSFTKIFQDDGLFKLRFGNKFIVCVFHQRHLGSLLSSFENIQKSTEYSFLHDWLGDGLLMSKGYQWKTQRKTLTTHVFHKKNHSNFLKIINRVANEHFLDAIYDTKTNLAIPIIRALTNSLFEAEFKDTFIVKEYFESMHFLANKFPERALSPLLWPKCIYKLTKTGREFYQKLEYLNKITRNILEESSQTLLIPFGCSETEILQQINTFLFAGHDTTSLVLAWILYYLGRFPEHQSEIYEECCSVIADIKQINQDSLNKLSLLERFINEVLRLHPPVPMIGREITESISLSNHVIPSGTMIYVLLDQVQLQSCHEPHRFNPKRYQNILPELRPPMMPFSAGPRNCVGKNFAWILLKVFTAKIVHKYCVKTREIDTTKTKYNITMAPSDDIQLELLPRQ